MKPFYDLSWWMANLGVLPLLLFCAFLFLPNLAFLLARRLRVTRVLETIFQLLAFILYGLTSVLPQIGQFVKIALCGGLISPILAEIERRPLILGRGEVKKIILPDIKKYTVGNKEVLKVWAKDGPSSLVLKGASLGSSDLLVWPKSGPSVLYQVIVVGKREQLKWAKWRPLLSPLGISAHYHAGELKLEGELQDYAQYLSFKKLFHAAHAKKSQENFMPLWETGSLRLSPALKKKIQAEVFYIALKSYRDDLDCHFQDVFLECSHYSHLKLPKDLKRQMESKALMRWPSMSADPQEQFKVKMVLFQFENNEGGSIQLGLDLLQGRLEDIFDRGPVFFIKQNQALFNQQSTHASTLAEPQLVIRPGKKGNISIGSDIPFQSKREEEITLGWRFAGLKIEVEATHQGDKILLQYQAELTYPTGEGSISGGRESSQVLVSPQKPFKLFEIGHRSLNNHYTALPVIAKIPVLKSLLSSRQKQQSYKKIVAIVTVEKMND